MLDWRPTRKAIEAAYSKLGREIPRDIPRADWDFAAAVLESYREASRRTCCECAELIEYRAEIVCLDCKAPLHERCAPKHFWPKGRQTTSPPAPSLPMSEGR
jgi:hypothetical protein